MLQCDFPCSVSMMRTSPPQPDNDRVTSSRNAAAMADIRKVLNALGFSDNGCYVSPAYDYPITLLNDGFRFAELSSYVYDICRKISIFAVNIHGLSPP